MSDERGRIPPLFWINDAGSGLPMSIAVSGRRVICFFSLELMTTEYAERHLGGQLGVHWYPAGSEDPGDLYRMADGASRQGFDGWVLNPAAPDNGHPVFSWAELRGEVERKLDVGAAWGAAPCPSSRGTPVGTRELRPAAVDGRGEAVQFRGAHAGDGGDDPVRVRCLAFCVPAHAISLVW